ncbi:MAG: hypothetical protein NW220_18815 [Leptolyngbyaceae cyanobacterium bins.349]|nr:hypothetical protein [Leptolyngbyaceae cyanobacterium bins.349]
MQKPLDEARSQELAQQVKSKSKAPFDNAHRGALALKEATYVQGFLVIPGKRCTPREHAWLELEDCLIDPSWPFLNQAGNALHYFPAQRLSVKQLKAAIEEAKEDYPDDPPLPIYGTMPYEYYGDVMLGGKEYQEAHAAAQAKCRDFNQPMTENGKAHQE